MTNAFIEHVNLTVADSERAAQRIADVFGWHIRWRGAAASGGHTVHVGTERHYLALYTPPGGFTGRHDKGAPLNHVGIEVADLEATERKVRALGLKPFGHGDYAPGRRFYFFDEDGIEFEIVSYAKATA